jgi:hypothetical protein
MRYYPYQENAYFHNDKGGFSNLKVKLFQNIFVLFSLGYAVEKDAQRYQFIPWGGSSACLRPYVFRIAAIWE